MGKKWKDFIHLRYNCTTFNIPKMFYQNISPFYVRQNLQYKKVGLVIFCHNLMTEKAEIIDGIVFDPSKVLNETFLRLNHGQ